MIIDAHCHVYPDKIAVKASKATGDFYEMDMYYDGKISTLLEAGTKAGVDKFIIQSVATTPAQVRSINDFISNTVSQYPDRMFGLGTLHFDSPDIEGDVDHLQSLGLKGVKLHPDIQNVKIDDERCMKIYEICEKRNIPLLIHTGDTRYDNSNPNRIIPVLDHFPDITIIGAHFGGWSLWVNATEQLHGRKNFLVDCSSSLPYLDDETVIRLLNLYGMDNVLFGTDYPMWEPAAEVQRLKQLAISEEDKEKIFSLNAIRVFKLDI